ncbi:HhH-GPD-type base excision DNA repair protein [Micromonospora echinaurantiaca]|nr:HhH-GPD-type base excision DNA repair protein [Micromonospora echinaurantiaca]
MTAMTLALPIDPEANRLLARSPLALLLGMVLDQQVPMEKAFSSPYVLTQRLGHEPDAAELAGYDPEALVALFAQPPALHRFPKAMAARVQEVCRVLVDRYDGDAARLWSDAADGRELLRRIADLPGFGKQKAQIFLALLGKRFDVTPEGWREAAGGYGDPDAHRSVADVVDADSLRRVREYKQQMKAAAKAKSAPA